MVFSVLGTRPGDAMSPHRDFRSSLEVSWRSFLLLRHHLLFSTLVFSIFNLIICRGPTVGQVLPGTLQIWCYLPLEWSGLLVEKRIRVLSTLSCLPFPAQWSSTLICLLLQLENISLWGIGAWHNKVPLIWTLPIYFIFWMLWIGSLIRFSSLIVCQPVSNCIWTPTSPCFPWI